MGAVGGSGCCWVSNAVASANLRPCTCCTTSAPCLAEAIGPGVAQFCMPLTQPCTSAAATQHWCCGSRRALGPGDQRLRCGSSTALLSEVGAVDASIAQLLQHQRPALRCSTKCTCMAGAAHSTQRGIACSQGAVAADECDQVPDSRKACTPAVAGAAECVARPVACGISSSCRSGSGRCAPGWFVVLACVSCRGFAEAYCRLTSPWQVLPCGAAACQARLVTREGLGVQCG